MRKHSPNTTNILTWTLHCIW